MLHVLRPVGILRKQWKLSVAAIFSLSVALTLGVVALSIGNTFLFLPPAGADPGRLVTIYAENPGEDSGHISYPDYEYFRKNNHVFTDVAASPNSIGVQESMDSNGAVKLVSRPVSDNYLSVLGIQPYLGRFFSPGDDTTKTKIALLTYSAWKRLGSDPNIAGKMVADHTIIGVTPQEFTGSLYGLNGDLLKPLPEEFDPSWYTNRGARRLVLLARLKPGTTKKQAQADMTTLSAQLASAYPAEDKGVKTFVTRATLLPPDALPTVEFIIGILMGLVLLVLLIACANVANLLLAVAVGRRQEAAIKLALGAHRGRLIREFLRESAVICGAGGLIAYLTASALIARFPDISVSFPTLGTYSAGLNLHLDATVAAFTLGLLALATVATGIAPALYASSPHLAEILSGEIAVGGTRKSIRRNVLVIAEVAVCTLVLMGTGLCLRSLYNLRHSDTGFSARNLVAITVLPPPANADKHEERPSEDQIKQNQRKVRDGIAVLPGIEAVTFARDLPLHLGYSETPVLQPGSDQKVPVYYTMVDDNYFSTLGIQMLAGRTFDSSDRENGPDSIVINRKMAETFWRGQDAVGKSLMAGDPPRKAVVIGVTVDSKYGQLDETTPPVMYYSLSQRFQPTVTVIAKTRDNPHLWVEPINQTVRALGEFSLFPPVTFDSWLNFNLIMQRITAGGVGALSALGLLLAVLGLFGAISYSVSERKKELGIRVALGATSPDLIKMVLIQTLRTTAIGVGIGVALGVAATAMLRSQFYGISPVEWTVILPVSAGMIGVSLLVAYLSALPWIAVDAMEAVRHA
jgi:putative ABC transport system permease protein